jgi:SAM-dependent methyltransferase
MPFRCQTRLLGLGLTWAMVTAVAAGSVAATWAQDEPAPNLEQLEGQLHEAYASKDYARALEVAERLRAIIGPKYIETLYDIARLHCLLGHKDQALEWLEKVVDAGYRDARRLERDDGFESIREDERFRALVRRTWAPRYNATLEGPQRVDYQKPDEVMAALALKPGERVADIGAGSGYFTIPVAKAIGPSGVVWAVEIKQPLLDHIQKVAQKEKLANVRLKLVREDDPQLPAAGVDTVLIVNTWHHIRNRSEYAKKLRAALAPGGRVVIVDHILEPGGERPRGLRPEHVLSREMTDAEFAEAGLKPIKVHDFLPGQCFVEYGVE